MYSFSYLEPVCYSMSSSNCCFLTCIQISQVVWYSHLFQNFQSIVIHTVKGFGIVHKAETDVFLEHSCFFDDPADLAICSLVPLPFLKPAWTSGSSWFTYCWSLPWRILSISWRRTWQPTPVLLPGKPHGWRRLVGYRPWSRKESAQLSDFTFFFLC